jgi:hypothetical protein
LTELSEDPAARASRYIATLDAAFRKAKPRDADTGVRAVNVSRVSDAIQRYLQDARHYLDKGRGTTALASVAYAEGLLDALVFLELA